ncbi:unnamed protein product [Gadus morhua 'NCC']
MPRPAMLCHATGRPSPDRQGPRPLGLMRCHSTGPDQGRYRVPALTAPETPSLPPANELQVSPLPGASALARRRTGERRSVSDVLTGASRCGAAASCQLRSSVRQTQLSFMGCLGARLRPWRRS